MSNTKTTLEIRKFPVQNMKHGCTVLILGPRRTGKSVLLKFLLYQLNKRKKFHVGYAMGGSLDARKDIQDILPESFNLEFSVPEYKRRIDQIVKMEEVIKEQDLSILACYDDCTYDKTFLKCKETRNIAMNGRHYNMTDFKCMQYVMDMPPDVRTQMDYVFVTKQSRLDIMQKIWKFFFGIFPRFEDFQNVLTDCTNDYEVLVLDNTKPTNKIEECVFYFKADTEIPKFKLFAPQYWILDRYYRELVNRKKNKQLQESAGVLISSTNLNANEGGSNTTKRRKSIAAVANSADSAGAAGGETGVNKTKVLHKLEQHLDDNIGEELQTELCQNEGDTAQQQKDLQNSVTKSIKIRRN